jgi:polyphosphate kinase
LEQVITAHLEALFPGMEVVEAHPFRIIRDADIEIQELEADDLLEAMQQSIRRRKFGSVVKVAIYEDMPTHLRDLLVENLQVKPTDVYVTSSNLGLARLWQLYNSIDRHDLKYPLYKPAIPKQFSNAAMASDIFEIIQQNNILLHHPYDSFTPVVDFLNAAARDPDVLAIKQTLYRTGQNSPIVEALLEAAENGKQVAVLVELKARFDEESNIGWAQTLERAGVHVVYGLVGLKTHCKITMVVRMEGEGIRRYLHIATGNYNAITSGLYEDIGMFTCDETMGEDATDLYNYLTGYSTKQDYKKLLVAPVNLREKLVELIRREIDHAKHKRDAHLIFKVNSLVDKPIIQLLYEASQSGVKIDLLVRGICSLKPGIKDVSENIRVISVLGRYLEHSRIYYFLNNDEAEIYLGSADLMPRNLNHRVEVVFPVERKEHICYLRDHVLKTYIKDNMSARRMQPDGTYKRLQPAGKEAPLNVQSWLMENPSGKVLR